MNLKLKNLTEEINDNTDILVEYLKMILERLDIIIEKNYQAKTSPSANV